MNYHRNRSGAEAAVAEITAAGGKTLAFQADVADPEAVKAMVAAGRCE